MAANVKAILKLRRAQKNGVMIYTYHKDIPNDCWNVFEVVDGIELFHQSFATIEEAQMFCDQMNGKAAAYAS